MAYMTMHTHSCGVTDEFCTSDCQSNCVVNPTPPPCRAENGVVKRVIGYYEAWMINSNCRRTEPEDLPLDAITHLNYVFAFLTPGTFDIVPMEGSIPVSLFKRITDLKKLKPGL